jgi:hypothetical protein
MLLRSGECFGTKAVGVIADHGGRLREEAERLRASDPDPNQKH